ncbi:MAG: energy transducer TonB, partial [Rhodothermales bacterium]|nr:energy transducer TonB [Rhodothermales bacterium]
MRRSLLALVPLLLVLSAGCGGGGGAQFEPPPGWNAEGLERWWQEGVDTSVAYRDLDSLAAMGVLSEGGPTHRNIQRHLAPLYRNHPEIVDSLFQAVVVPRIESGEAMQDREAFLDDISRQLTRTFQYARPLTEQPDEARVVYPDSLREAGVAGRVVMQVYVSEAGETLAIEKIEGVNP